MSDTMLLFLGLRLDDDALGKLLRHVPDAAEPYSLAALADELNDLLQLNYRLELRGAPSFDFRLSVEGVERAPAPKAGDMLIFALAPLNQAQLTQLERQLDVAIQRKRVSAGYLSVDLPTAPTDVNVWCPNEAPFPLFGQRGLALERIRADAAGTKHALGDNVNVVMVDQGLNRTALRNYFPQVKFRGGWSAPEFGRGGPPGPPRFISPGEWPDGHATKMAETVLSVTPHVNIFDLPLMPSHIVNLGGFLSWAASVYWLLNVQIPWLKLFSPYKGPWVLCNAWAVYNLTTDAPVSSPLNYGQNPSNLMNRAVANLPRVGLADIVFAAGNCGQFCPDGRCGPADIGPGHSIHGVAAIADVLTVGAVRSDTLWLGYSSQGPAPAGFGSAKPDLCAPSQFAHPTDWNRSYTGSSTPCALATGALAAARSYSSTEGLTPPKLRARAAAAVSVPVGAVVPNGRLGAGIIDINALLGP